MLIDCDTCAAPATACRDCVMTVLLDRPGVPVELDDAEHQALGELARAGLVPPLRLVVGLAGGVSPAGETEAESAGESPDLDTPSDRNSGIRHDSSPRWFGIA
jgi:hypothetical protein